ncbi:preprotein translocase subunit SecA [Xylanimonas allomyrinae]|uniref:Protein translocase subunit SecA n=1 Tax=Xylanimonas allomyrinae TaxID=2509459 RepID=A0A4P6EPM8_9MICO|nr:preprotein translocase subunit SecA [Xylanimonas allomyrinae]QAY63329.1 preprotein translocase subunit SecA [Xylanimonas allomyrinae]
MPAILEKVLRLGEGRVLKKLHGLAQQVNALEQGFTDMSDEELREETARFKERLTHGETLDDLLPEAFATVREAARRTLGQRHFDVQLMGGAALHLGNIAEMKTGEGKTLVATTAAYLNALEGKGVHVVTTNDYLAKYQGELMGRVYRFLGMTAGVILTGQTPAERREQYACDITYGTNNEFGFDYLRDNMAWSTDDLVQRGHHFAIVDEVDSILIDEARTPLIISGPSSGDANRWYTEFSKVVRRLNAGADYEVDEKKRTVGVLEPGIAKIEDYLGIDNLYESLNTPLIGFLNNAIKAKELFKRDKDYVVLNGEVMIVDEHTGRMLPGRRYNEGMHQAIEAKEGVAIKAENQTLATITLQNYFRLYDKLSGMTGTAETEAAEFQGTYKIGVVPIPTNRPMIRIDQPDLVYKNEEGKFAAVVTDIVERHAKGQPVLVGTTSVEKSEYLSGLLRKAGVPHSVLNAKEHEREASVVALAGRKGAVTVATNMAGRGTDIMLGGNAEFLAVQKMAERGYDAVERAEEYEDAWPGILEEAKAAVAAEHDEVTGLGGLYVLGTERHESRRIDNQLRGRSGRQGDPGESRFYLSMQDDLMRLFNSGLAESMMNRAGFPDDVPLESKMVTRGIQSAQSQVEARNFEIRKNVLKYDDVLSRQREVIYSERRRVLEGEDLADQITHFRTDVITAYVDGATSDGAPESWDLEGLWTALKSVYPVSITVDDVVEEAGGIGRVSREMVLDELLSDAVVAYSAREELLGEQGMRQLERRVVLSVLDRKWREHLYEMDYLKEGIGLRAMAQRDPLVEYQREGFQLFSAMTDAIKEESVGFLYNLEVQVQQAPAEAAPAVTVAGAAAAAQSAPDLAPAAPAPDASTQPEAAAEEAPDASGTAPSAPGATKPAAPVLLGKGLEDRGPQVPLSFSGPSESSTGVSASSDATDATRRSRRALHGEAQAAEADGRTFPGTPRNAQCPCGSGKKYKVCHGLNEG